MACVIAGVVILLADALLVVSVNGVTPRVLARHLQVVQAPLLCHGQGFAGAGAVKHAQRKELVLACLRGTVVQAPRLDRGSVGFVAASIAVVGIGSGGRAWREGAADLARIALFFEVIEVCGTESGRRGEG